MKIIEDRLAEFSPAPPFSTRQLRYVPPILIDWWIEYDIWDKCGRIVYQTWRGKDLIES